MTDAVFPAASSAPASGAFAARLQALRREAGLSQTQLAGTELSPSYISLLESGKRQPSSEVVAYLAEKLGCSPSRLWEGRSSERERRLELELAYARLAMEHGEESDARARLDRLLQEGSLDRRSEDETRFLLGRAYEKLGDLPRAVELLTQLFERSRIRETHLSTGTVGTALFACHADSGDFHRAVVVGEAALHAIVQQGLSGTDEYYRLAASLLWAYSEVGDLAYAMTWARRLIKKVEARGEPRGQAAIYWNAAIVAEELGNVDEAVRLSERALHRLSETPTTRDLVRLRISTGQLLLSLRPPRAEEAWRTLDLARDQLDDLGSSVDRARWERTAATAKLLLGDLAAARALIAAAAGRDLANEREEAASTATILGDVRVAEGLTDEGLAHYRTAMELLRQAPPARATARAWRDLGDRFADREHAAEAATCFERALTIAGLPDRSAPIRAALSSEVRPMLPRQ